MAGAVSPCSPRRCRPSGWPWATRTSALSFAEAATASGVARCVRPGIMNNYESPWDGKLVVGQLVRWVTLKP